MGSASRAGPRARVKHAKQKRVELPRTGEHDGTNRAGPGEGITKSIHTTAHQVQGHNTGTDAGVQGNRKAGAPATLVSEPGLA